MHPLLVIGGGLAGWTTVREFRKLDTTTPVAMITADSGDFYAKPSLSNAFAQGKSAEDLVTTPAARMAETLAVALMPRTRVLAIDTRSKQVATTAGEVAYGRLVLATGAQPIRIPVGGSAAGEIVSVNSLEDFAVFHARLRAGKRHVLIMGAGLIGCEFANDLAQAGHRVSVVDPSPRPLAALLPEAASQALQRALEAIGVQFYLGTTVGTVDAGTHGLDIGLANHQRLAADSVLSAVGLKADTALAQAAGLVVDRGMVVDARLQTSAPDVYALGDGAQYASAVTPQSAHGMTLPYVMPIMSAAKVLAANLAGTPTELAFPLMPVAVKTPALPLVIASPRPGLAGQWREAEEGVWQWLDDSGRHRGFALWGKQTSQRMAQGRLVTL